MRRAGTETRRPCFMARRNSATTSRRKPGDGGSVPLSSDPVHHIRTGIWPLTCFPRSVGAFPYPLPRQGMTKTRLTRYICVIHKPMVSLRGCGEQPRQGFRSCKQPGLDFFQCGWASGFSSRENEGVPAGESSSRRWQTGCGVDSTDPQTPEDGCTPPRMNASQIVSAILCERGMLGTCNVDEVPGKAISEPVAGAGRHRM